MLRVLAAAAAAVTLAAAVWTSKFVFVFIALGALLFLASSFSEAARAIGPLHDLILAEVELHVWDTPLPSATGQPFILVSVKALGAGLHLYVRAGQSSRLEHLKIAQPKGIALTGGGVIIASASYVQWLGSRLPKVIGTPAFEVRRTVSRGGAPEGAV